MPDTLETLSASEIGRRVRAKDLSPTESVRAALDRIETRNPSLNAFVHVDPEGALAAAKRLEERIARGEDVGPLAGVPVAMKDLFNTYPGWPSTLGGIRALQALPQKSASYFPTKMEQAGAIVVGATNSPVFGFRGTCDNPVHGPTRNPFDPARNSGGSSGGSAAAVADGMVPIGGATDGGGSIRIPSAWCNTFGFQPSYGRVPSAAAQQNAFELTNFAYTGAITRTVEDGALALQTLMAFDPAELFSLPADIDLPGAKSRSMAGVRIGFTPDLGIYPVNREIAEHVHDAASALATLGAEIVPIEVQLPSHRALTELWCRLVGMRMAGAIERFKRNGLDLARDHGAELPKQIWMWIDRANALTELDLRQDQLTRTAAFDGLQRALLSVDIIACPTVACLPVENAPHGETLGPDRIDEVEVDPLIGWCLTYLTNLTGNPAASLPAGLVGGLPVGLQLIGRRLDDARLMGACAAFERVRPWAQHYDICQRRRL